MPPRAIYILTFFSGGGPPRPPFQLCPTAESNPLSAPAVTSNLKSTTCVQRACNKGRKAFFSLLSYGVKPLGLNAIHSISLYKKIVLPSLLYGCELWNNLSKRDIADLEKFQHYCCKNILGLPKQTRSDMCESIVGLFKLPAEIDRRKLMFLHKLCTLPGTSSTKQLFLYRLFSYFFHDNLSKAQQGFIPDICKLLSDYGLLHALETFVCKGTVVSKLNWKRCVNHAIRVRETRMWRLRMAIDDDFSRFRLIHKSIKTATLLKAPKTTFEIKLIDHSVRLLTCIPQTANQICPLCTVNFDDVARHILTSCTHTLCVRDCFWQYVTNVHGVLLNAELHNSTDECFLAYLLGMPTEFVFEGKHHKQFLLAAAAFIRQAAAIYFSNM